MTMILGWLTSKIAGPIAAGLAALFAIGFFWQTAQIDGWPIIGGGYRQQVAKLTSDYKDLQIAQQNALQKAQEAQGRAQKAADAEAAANAKTQQASESRTQIIIRKVPVYVTQKSDAACVVPWGVVRLLDAAISGSDPDSVEARLAPGQPDDAASDVKLSEIVSVLAGDFGAANENADQLTHLEAAVRAGQ